MCSSGVGFNPVVNGTHFTFDVYGLYNGLFVMDDRQTGSVWTHYDGAVLTGPMAGTGAYLEIQPLLHITWDEWRSLHPGTLVLDWYREFADRYRQIKPGRGGLSPQFQATLLYEDDRLPINELVLGASVNGQSRAYVMADFSGRTAINDTLGDLPIVILFDREADVALAYLAVVNGQTRLFSVDQGTFLDDTGNQWDINGRALAGPLGGTQLTFVTSFVTEWYGWAAYHPDTSIYGR